VRCDILTAEHSGPAVVLARQLQRAINIGEKRMSHSENDMNRQVKRHRGPLIGFIALGAFVAILLVWWLGGVVTDAEDATDAQVPAQGTSLSITGPDEDATTTVPAQNPTAATD
jgi:hypothetical protein